jgi:hypothetical protein
MEIKLIFKMLWFYIRIQEQGSGEKTKINNLEHHYFSADSSVKQSTALFIIKEISSPTVILFFRRVF